MLLVRPVIASSGNHSRAVFFPHVTVLNTLYAKAGTSRLFSLQTFNDRSDLLSGRFIC